MTKISIRLIAFYLCFFSKRLHGRQLATSLTRRVWVAPCILIQVISIGMREACL